MDPVRAASRRYAVVFQDTRGRHASEGEFYPFRHEGEDGFDTIEWCAEQPVPVDTEQPCNYEIDLGPTSMMFRRGHRLRLQVSSSNFPYFARNPNAAGSHHDDSDVHIAAQTVLHDADHPSCLVLPVAG